MAQKIGCWNALTGSGRRIQPRSVPSLPHSPFPPRRCRAVPAHHPFQPIELHASVKLFPSASRARATRNGDQVAIDHLKIALATYEAPE